MNWQLAASQRVLSVFDSAKNSLTLSVKPKCTYRRQDKPRTADRFMYIQEMCNITNIVSSNYVGLAKKHAVCSSFMNGYILQIKNTWKI